MNKRLLLLVAFVLPLMTYAQQEAWVYFKDKQNVETAIANPNSILTQRAIDRKNAHGIAIDERDVPLNESYKSQINNITGIDVLAKSKWMNAIHVSGSASDINDLKNLDFVERIDFANDDLNDLRSRSVEDKFQVENENIVFTYGTTKNQVEMLNTDDLHLADYTGDGMIIAVMDSGFPNVETMGAFARMRAAGKYLGGYDFHDRTSDVTAYSGGDHGTKVLSTMGGFIQNEFVGTAPDASYYIFRTEVGNFERPVELSYWVEAAERADSLGVDVINTSLGYTTFDNPSYNFTPSDMDGNTTFISKGANIAAEKGMLVVTSAGNSGNSSWEIVSAPADAPGSFSIGAVTPEGNYATFSSRGSNAQPTQKPDVVAQGAPASVVNRDNIIVNNNGTSFSSPIMAGSLASLWQAMPNTTAEQLKQIVRESSSQANNPDNFLGFGIPDFSQALGAVLSSERVEEVSFKMYPNPTSGQLYFKASTDLSSVEFSIYNVLGKKILTVVGLNGSRVLDVSSLANGIYLIKLKGPKLSKTLKFVKR